MNRRRVFAVTAALAVAACIPGPTYSLRYRLSIAVRAGGRVHSGSSVMSMRWGDVGGMASCNGGDRYARNPAGEAIVVDMAENGKIFGLISVPTIDAEGFQISGPERAFIPLLPPSDMRESESGENILRRLSSLTGVHPLAREHWPIMIRFRDLLDQTSVELIDRDDLSTLYGDGAAIEAVTMSVVDEPVTRGEVTRALPWLAEWGGALIRPVPGGPRTLAHRINDRHFIRKEGDD